MSGDLGCLLLSQVHLQGARSEVQHVGLEPVMLGAVMSGSSLACSIAVLLPSSPLGAIKRCRLHLVLVSGNVWAQARPLQCSQRLIIGERREGSKQKGWTRMFPVSCRVGLALL